MAWFLFLSMMISYSFADSETCRFSEKINWMLARGTLLSEDQRFDLIKLGRLFKETNSRLSQINLASTHLVKHGIDHQITNEGIEILESTATPLNKMVASLRKKMNVAKVIYDPSENVDTIASITFEGSLGRTSNHKIYVSHRTIVTGQPDPYLFHEIQHLHLKNHFLRRRFEKIRPWHGRIVVMQGELPLRAAKHAFSLEEMETYSRDLRGELHRIHLFSKGKDSEKLKRTKKSVQETASNLKKFSAYTEEIFEDVLEDFSYHYGKIKFDTIGEKNEKLAQVVSFGYADQHQNTLQIHIPIFVDKNLTPIERKNFVLQEFKRLLKYARERKKSATEIKEFLSKDLSSNEIEELLELAPL